MCLALTNRMLADLMWTEAWSKLVQECPLGSCCSFSLGPSVGIPEVAWAQSHVSQSSAWSRGAQLSPVFCWPRLLSTCRPNQSPDLLTKSLSTCRPNQSPDLLTKLLSTCRLVSVRITAFCKTECWGLFVMQHYCGNSFLITWIKQS